MEREKNYWIAVFSLLFLVGGIYFSNQVYTIYGGDAGDLASAIVTRGIPHPPGYPLYTALGIIANEFIRGGTTAWRVGFLSSIPALLALLFLFDLIFYLTKKLSVSLVSVLVLAFSYPFWLYSEVVEVFSLNNLFLVLLIWSFVRFAHTAGKKYLYAGSFLFGLSLSHHQIILFLLPTLLIFLWRRKKLLEKKDLFKCLFLTVLGWLPYLYLPIAASFNPGLNWLGVPTIDNFLGLITRSSYGTFRAGVFIGHEPLLRLFSIWGFIDLALKDFRITGVILFLLGAVCLFRREKTLFWAFSVGLASYLFFLFYASFPLGGNFIVGTFERFVLPLYILVSVFIAFGLVLFWQLLAGLSVRILSRSKTKIVISLAGLIFFIYPAGLAVLNFPKISILKNDFTAENLGSDILSSVPEDSIILLSVDTQLFDTQYVYFSQKKWPKVKPVHFYRLLNPATAANLKKFYPDMILPDFRGSPKKEFDTFIAGNYPKSAIFSTQAYVSEGGVWVPWGLLFRYFKNEDLPSDAVILAENRKLWLSYHDSLSGSLARYKNLLLSDILRVYSYAHQEIGFWAAKRAFNDDAERHLLTAEKLTPDDLDSYNILSQVYIEEKRCDEAKKQIDYRIAKDKEDPNSYLLLSLDYSLCYKDASNAAFYQKLYEEKQKGKETPLRKI